MDKRLNDTDRVPSEGFGAVRASLQTAVQGPSACHRFIRSRRGQQVVEYGLLIAAISAALFAMFIYGKRGLQLLLRETTASEVEPQLEGSSVIPQEVQKSEHSLIHTQSGEDTHMNFTRGETRYDFDSWSNSTGASMSETATVVRDPGGVDVPPSNPSSPSWDGHVHW